MNPDSKNPESEIKQERNREFEKVKKEEEKQKIQIKLQEKDHHVAPQPDFLNKTVVIERPKPMYTKFGFKVNTDLNMTIDRKDVQKKELLKTCFIW